MSDVADNTTTLEARCRCGHTRDNFWVRPARTYGVWGLICMMFGVTTKPSRVDYKCAHCEHTFETITDPAELERFRHWDPKP